ncbi:MAG: class I SAM-dependent methyltransferase [Planctomycetes bacterium]|nr:class I SAM-dependent methyltransferase [Planctomycetota bacterium]
MRILDAGCGGGRNLLWFLQAGYDVRALDPDAAAIAAVRAMAAELGREADERRFRVESLEASSFDAASADVVICSAVLHFARDPAHFRAMLDGAWRLLAPGGLLFARLASSVGLGGKVVARGDGRFLLPDGSERFLIDEQVLIDEARRLGAQQLDPIKSTVVQGMRTMATWVVRRPASVGDG